MSLEKQEIDTGRIRVSGGEFRGRWVRVPAGLEIRPTTDVIRQAVFNILQGEIQESLFLDLCCGTGIMGIEALSRGADRVLFVDKNRESRQLVTRNLELFPVSGSARVVEMDILRFLSTFKEVPESGRLIMYFDPPYKDKKLYRQVFSRLDRMNPEDLIFFIEHGEPLVIEKALHLRLWKQKRYGSKWISVFTTIPDFW
ncbi:MAG: 16S rRNA (guanine(966)-N(2))-methyltransferase RsmD [Acidobacteria bacterium]|nr:16S rRNA (guanine(966)-N(2))-methyltransferase RsmD [Acidobacteriota bacterium]